MPSTRYPDPADIAQERAIAAWQAEQTYNSSLGIPLSAWKAHKAWFAEIDFIRQWTGGRRLVSGPVTLVTMDGCDATEVLDGRHIQPPTFEPRLMRAIGALPANYRRAVYLRYWEDRSHEEIAESLGTTLYTVGNMMHIIRMKLRMLLTAPDSDVRRRPRRYPHWVPGSDGNGVTA